MDIVSEQLIEQVPAATSAGETPPPLTPWSALAGMLIRPRATFERMREGGRSYWWLMLAVTVVAAALLAYATTSVRMAAFQSFSAGAGSAATGTTAVQGSGPAASGASSSVTAILVSAGVGVVGVLAGYVVCTVVVLGVGLAMGGSASFKHIFPVAVWASLPLALRDVVHAATTLVSGKTVSAGFSGLFTASEAASLPVLNTLAGQFDIYLLWSLLLLGIGIVVMTKLSKGKSAVVVLVYVVAAAGLLLASNWAMSALSGLLGTNLRVPGLMNGGGVRAADRAAPGGSLLPDRGPALSGQARRNCPQQRGPKRLV